MREKCLCEKLVNSEANGIVRTRFSQDTEEKEYTSIFVLDRIMDAYWGEGSREPELIFKGRGITLISRGEGGRNKEEKLYTYLSHLSKFSS